MKTTDRRFATGDVWPAQRLSRWSAFGREIFGALDVEPDGPRSFEGRMSTVEIGGLILTTVVAAKARAFRREDGGDLASGDAFMLSMPLAGHGTYVVGDVACEVSPGDVFVRDLSSPWKVEFHEAFELLTVRLPYDLLLDRLEHPEALLGQTFRAADPATGCLYALLLSAQRLATEDATFDKATQLCGLILDALRLLPSGRPPAIAASAALSGPALRREARRHAVRNIADPSLSPAGVAAALNVHPRKLQRVFSTSGPSLRDFILQRRLDLAAELLCAPAGGRRPKKVVEIAFAVGFADPAYFSRAFASRFGLPPARFRAQRRRGVSAP